MSKTDQQKELPSQKIQEYLDFALSLAREAGELILKWRREGFSVAEKDDRSVVTQADRAVEELLRSRITARFPDHAIIGEEFPATGADNGLTWVLDPIDGTLNFCHDLPTYACIIGLFDGKTPLVGVINHPALGLLYSAGRGMGSFCNNEPIHIADCQGEPSAEIVAISNQGNFRFTGEPERFAHLATNIPNLRMYYDCFSHTLAARGSLSTIAYNVHRWDLAATQILVEEAGGQFEELPKVRGDGGIDFYRAIFGKPRVVAWLKELLAKISNETLID